ncbi:hypothetical protein [Paenibacillus tyrfis]|uniref:hypothetical protein n=1 Tax=Paenibacillus tyrfis TaxID=1501230 RepID=UPI000B590D80|nr:hypothetical protein [Paenibacillus tyrfis]
MKKLVFTSLIATLSLTMMAGGAYASESNFETAPKTKQISSQAYWSYNWQVSVGWEEDLYRYSNGGVSFAVMGGDGAVFVSRDGHAKAVTTGSTLIYSRDVSGDVRAIFRIQVV